MKKVLVVGATGLLGRHVVQALAGTADVVTAVTTIRWLTSISRCRTRSRPCTPSSVQWMRSSAAGMVPFAPWDQATGADWAAGVASKLMGQVNLVRIGAPFVSEGGSFTFDHRSSRPAPDSRQQHRHHSELRDRGFRASCRTEDRARNQGERGLARLDRGDDGSDGDGPYARASGCGGRQAVRGGAGVSRQRRRRPSHANVSCSQPTPEERQHVLWNEYHPRPPVRRGVVWPT